MPKRKGNGTRPQNSKLVKVGSSRNHQALITGYGFMGDVEAARRTIKDATAAVKALRVSRGSQTKTKKKQSKTKWSIDTMNGIKYKTVRVSYKAAKRQKMTQKLSQVGRVWNYGNGGQISGIGQQSASTPVNLTNFDLKALHTALNDGVATTAPRANELLNFIGSTDEIEFLNCAPTPVEFEIYCCIDKITALTSTDPGNTWVAGLAAEQNDVSLPTELFSNPWLKPTEVKAFNIAYWSKRYPVTLTPGEKCKFTFKFNRNRLLDTSYQDTYQQIRGITHKIFVVQRGTTVDSTNTKTVAANGQSISETKLVFIRKQTLTGSILNTLPKVNKHVLLSGGVAGGDLPIALAGQWHIDEDTGEPEDANVVGEFA